MTLPKIRVIVYAQLAPWKVPPSAFEVAERLLTEKRHERWERKYREKVRLSGKVIHLGRKLGDTKPCEPWQGYAKCPDRTKDATR